MRLLDDEAQTVLGALQVMSMSSEIHHRPAEIVDGQNGLQPYARPRSRRRSTQVYSGRLLPR
jgi:hypothetical protein